MMIAYRSYELSYINMLGISFYADSDVDKKILTFYEKNIILLNRLSGRLANLPEIISYRSHDLWEFFSKKVDTYFERVKKNKSESSKGSVSIYWDSVSEVKSSPRKETE